MLDFKEYRNKNNLGKIVENETSQIVDNIEIQINKIVDDFVKDLRNSLINPMPGTPKRGLWDRFKNGMSNLWHGRDNQNNPYFWQNKLGDDLGRQESFDPKNLKLHEYKSLKDICDSLEEEMNESVPGTENLRISKLIDSKAQELKQKLKTLVMSRGNEMPVAQTPVPEAPAPEAKPSEVPAKEEVPQEAPAAPGKFDTLWPEPGTKPEDKPEEAPLEQGEVFKNFRNIPPTKGKAWNELDSAEREAWNRYGGGIEKSDEWDTRSRGAIKEKGILNLPWILRIGDPRRDIIEKELPNRNRYNQLTAQKRFEQLDNPIKNVQDLESRLKDVKETVKNAKLFKREKLKQSLGHIIPATPKKAEPSPVEEPKATEPVSPVEPVNPVEEPKEELPKFRTAPVVDPSIEKDKIAGSVQSDDAPPKFRTTGIAGATALPPEEKKSSNKAALREKINNIKDKDVKKDLKSQLAQIKDKGSLRDLENQIETELKAQEELSKYLDDDSDF